MELADILIGQSAGIPQAEYDGQPLQERVPLLPAAPSIEESADDLATYLTAKEVSALAQDYFLTGNLAESARKARVRYPVALRISHELQFQEELVALEHQLKIRQKSILDGLLDKTLSQLQDRLEHGDEVMTKGGIGNVAVKARDLAAIAAILTERREKLDDATKPIVSGARRKVENLADQLREKAKAGASNAVLVEPKQVGNGA